jgi:hypothetical protein
MLSAFGLGGCCSRGRRGRLRFRIRSLRSLLSLHHSWRRAASDVASSRCCILSSLEGCILISRSFCILRSRSCQSGSLA